MERLLTLDAQNYPSDMPELLRRSARGIIFVDGKLLLIESSFGEVNCPAADWRPERAATTRFCVR